MKQDKFTASFNPTTGITIENGNNNQRIVISNTKIAMYNTSNGNALEILFDSCDISRTYNGKTQKVQWV